MIRPEILSRLRPRLPVLALLCLLVALLPSRGALAQDKKDIELRVMVFDPTSMPEAWRELLEIKREFEKRHPRVTVKLLSEGGGGDPLTKLRIMLAARQPLDIAAIDVLEFSSFLEDDILLDLTPHLEAIPAFDKSDYFSITLDAFRDRDRRLYGLPSTFTPYVMYVNKTILAREGIPFPRPDWTWDDLLSIARRCTRTEGDRQWGISITQWLQALCPWIWQNGGRLLTDDLTSCAFDDPATVEALDFLVRLFHEEKIAATDATYAAQATRGEFQAGNVALYGPVGYWEVYRFKEIDDFEWDVCPLPRSRTAATSVAMRSYVGIGYTEHPELVAEFLTELSGERMSRTLARIGNGVPGLKRAARSEDFLKPDVPPDSEQVFLDVLPAARFMPVLANWREIEHLIQQELQECLVFGRSGAAETASRITGKVNAFLERERRERERPRAPIAWLLAGSVAAFVVLVGGFLVGRGKRPASIRRSEERAGYAHIALWASGFLLFILGPMIASFALSLTRWTSIRPLDQARWAGLSNYSQLLEDPDFWKALQVTSEYTLLSVPLSLGVALGLALLVRKGFAVFRTIYYLPVVVSLVALGLLWRWIFGSDFVEVLLGARWIESETWIVPGFVLMSLWSVGGPMMIFLAGLQSIEPSLYEAARLDGASRGRQFLHVTLPQLGPVLLFNLIMGLIAAFQTFAQPYVMTDGGPGNASLFYVLYLFKMAFRFQNMGYASALGWVLFVLLLVLAIVLLRKSRVWVHYEGEVR